LLPRGWPSFFFGVRKEGFSRPSLFFFGQNIPPSPEEFFGLPSLPGKSAEFRGKKRRALLTNPPSPLLPSPSPNPAYRILRPERRLFRGNNHKDSFFRCVPFFLRCSRSSCVPAFQRDKSGDTPPSPCDVATRETADQTAFSSSLYPPPRFWLLSPSPLGLLCFYGDRSLPEPPQDSLFFRYFFLVQFFSVNRTEGTALRKGLLEPQYLLSEPPFVTAIPVPLSTVPSPIFGRRSAFSTLKEKPLLCAPGE